MEEGEVYEVVNIKTLKQATPNLRIINLYGISFIDDSHIEAFSSNCIQLQVLLFKDPWFFFLVQYLVFLDADTTFSDQSGTFKNAFNHVS